MTCFFLATILWMSYKWTFYRILFWTDWDASMPRIEAASMSGFGRRTIHKETGNGGWPNGLTVDYLERRILWIDARWEGCLISNTNRASLHPHDGQLRGCVMVISKSFKVRIVPLFVLFLPDPMPFTQPSMTGLGWSRFSVDTNTCHIRSPSPCTEEKFTGRTGAPTHSPKPTSGQETTSQWFREPTHSPLICRFIIHPDNHKVSGEGSRLTLHPIPYSL